MLANNTKGINELFIIYLIIVLYSQYVKSSHNNNKTISKIIPD